MTQAVNVNAVRAAFDAAFVPRWQRNDLAPRRVSSPRRHAATPQESVRVALVGNVVALVALYFAAGDDLAQPAARTEPEPRRPKATSRAPISADPPRAARTRWQRPGREHTGCSHARSASYRRHKVTL